jgi:hypothetical protein
MSAKYHRRRPGARVGKIARLPAAIRDEVNRRLFDGQPGHKILAWLNAQPVTRETLLELANCGARVTAQNLSQWRASGFREFLDLREQAEILRLTATAPVAPPAPAAAKPVS